MSDHEPDDQPQHKSPRRRGRSSNGDAVHIPGPRSPLDDQPDVPVPRSPDQPASLPPRHDGGRSENGLVEPEFRYNQTWKRGKRRRYNGFVERFGDAEGERLRASLAAVVRDLLDWAAQHTEAQARRDDNHNDDGTSLGGSDGEPGPGSGEDGDTR